MKRSLQLPQVMGLSSCKLPFPDIIIIIEAIVCIIKCKVLCNSQDLKNPTMAMKIQNGHFTFHYALRWLGCACVQAPPVPAVTVLGWMRRECFGSSFSVVEIETVPYCLCFSAPCLSEGHFVQRSAWSLQQFK